MSVRILGAAFFGPACGHNSARTTFAGAIATVRDSIDLAERLPTLVDNQDSAADVARHIAEDSLVRVWSSFQRFAEASYASTAAGAATPDVVGVDDAILVGQDIPRLNESHDVPLLVVGEEVRIGLADGYRPEAVGLVEVLKGVASGRKSGDQRYAIGQRLVVTPPEVLQLAAIVEKLAAGVTAALTP